MAKCWPIQVSMAQKAVLMSLADQANDAGVCWPAVGTLAERTCMSERNVVRAIADLEKLGLVLPRRVAGKATVYTVTPDTVSPLTQCHPCHPVTPPLTQCHPHLRLNRH